MSLLFRAIRVGLSAPILQMVSKVYIPVLFPLTFLISLCALWLDGLLGFKEGFLPEPTHYALAGGLFVAGATLWLLTYAQLVTHGKGSPSPTAGRTVHLVKTGIYAYTRNPSLYGKLLGVLAVGFALNSLSFCVILVPLLLGCSLLEKVWRQEPQLIELFGEDYLGYRKQVPLFLPWGLLFPSKRASREQS
jgi:protein-S-isoprenylcysteine O-methyltransferase Ste14